jgi:hypothetical protein
MDTPVDERRLDHVTTLISASVDNVSRLGCLAVDVIEQVAFFFSLLPSSGFLYFIKLGLFIFENNINSSLSLLDRS